MNFDFRNSLKANGVVDGGEVILTFNAPEVKIPLETFLKVEGMGEIKGISRALAFALFNREELCQSSCAGVKYPPLEPKRLLAIKGNFHL